MASLQTGLKICYSLDNLIRDTQMRAMAGLESDDSGLRAQLSRHLLLDRERERGILREEDVAALDAVRPRLVGARGRKQHGRGVSQLLDPLGLVFRVQVVEGNLGQHLRNTNNAVTL
jgi:hypothetical protein